MKKIMYFHYQACERDGSNTHTAAFEQWFSELCTHQAIDFKVIAPPLFSSVVPELESLFDRLKHNLARFYLRDFKLLLRQWLRMRRELKTLLHEAPDLVITRFDDNTLSIIWACRKLDIPVVVEINSPTIESTNAHYLHLPIFKRLYSNSHALSLAQGGFTVSDFLTENLKGFAGGKPFKTIPNGVDPLRFKSLGADDTSLLAELLIPDQRVVIGFVGSFAPWHGIGDLVEAFSSLVEAGKDVHLLLVGQTSASAQSTLERLQQPDLNGRVSLTGFVPLAEIPKYLSIMDITTIANTEDYCSPLKLFEYMAMSKAIVSVDTSAVNTVIRAEKEGLLFKRGDIDGFGKGLRRLVEDPELRARLGVAARTRVMNEFTWEHNADRVLELARAVNLGRQE